MEHCFRIALWMFFFIGYLQAKPVSSVEDGQSNNPGGKPCRLNMGSLGFDLLESVVCDNVNFTIPTHLTAECYPAALNHYKGELEKCGNHWKPVLQTLDALDTCSLPTQTNPSMCNWENQGSSKSFAEFVKALKTFVQMLNNASM